jgi:transposase
MAAERIDMDRLRELVRLHRLGTGAREVARLLQMSPNTEREYRQALIAASLLKGPSTELPAPEVLKAAVLEHRPVPGPGAHERSKIGRWAPKVKALLDGGLTPKVIWHRLREKEPDFNGSYSQVKRLCRALTREAGVRAKDVAIPVVTLPGKEAQVDFGYVGKLYDPEQKRLRKAWCFVMVLSHSRAMCVRVVFDQKITTWLRLHVSCFEELGGVPEIVRPDNLKAAVIRAAFTPSDPTELNRSYRELARHYGFKIDPTPPYSPEKKGKVESGVKYAKRAFFKGREGEPIDEVREALAWWVPNVAALRTHGTTGRVPAEAFAEEKPHLLELPPQPFELMEWKKAKVHQDSHVLMDKRFYSVPWRLVGREVWVRATEATIQIYADDTRVATHSRRGPGPRSTNDAHLPEGRRGYRYRDRAHWEKEAEAMGPHVAQLVTEIFDADDVLYALRPVQATMGLLSTLPPERVEAVCKRASFYGITSYGEIKRIVRKGLDAEPLPLAMAPGHGHLSAPRFARNLGELLTMSDDEEACHEPH